MEKMEFAYFEIVIESMHPSSIGAIYQKKRKNRIIKTPETKDDSMKSTTAFRLFDSFYSLSSC